MKSTMSPRNPNPKKSMLAFHFIQALARIKRSRARPRSSSPQANFQRGQRIRRAAYASMALAAGPRWAWSRAILHRLRRQARARAPAGRRVSNSNKVRVARPKAMEDGNRADKLRRLVLGGRRMDLCSLLEETRHYIRCLTSQVQLMQMLADSVSKQSGDAEDRCKLDGFQNIL